jgi:hypothetical protein
VTLQGSSLTTIENSDFTDSGLYLSDGANNNMIQNNYIHGNLNSTLIVVQSSGNGIFNNVIWNNGGQAAIVLDGASGTVIQGNYLGTDQSGTVAGGTTAFGIFSKNNDNNDNIIGGDTAGTRNVISGNSQGGIEIGGNNNWILGNFIGVDVTGANPLPNGTPGGLSNAGGITILGGSGNSIGGTTAGDGNVISANYYSGSGGSGITLLDNGGDLVAGNWIGTDATGTVAGLGNSGPGVAISSGSGDTIGGMTQAAGNVISGNSGDGLVLDSDGSLVEGNLIGTDTTGSQPLPNGEDGILIISSHNTIAANVISGNVGFGIQIYTNANLVQGNFIGTTLDNASALPNEQGGVYLDGAAFNTIGGTAGTAINVISGNAGQNLWIAGGNAIGNTVLGDIIGLGLSRQLLNGAPDADGVDITGGASGNFIEENLALRQVC